jgi:hypothetical protein
VRRDAGMLAEEAGKMRRNRRDPTTLYKRRAFTAAKATNKTTANANLSISPLVCTENAVRIDLVTESPNVEDDGRAVMLHPDAACFAFQVEEPT